MRWFGIQGFGGISFFVNTVGILKEVIKMKKVRDLLKMDGLYKYLFTVVVLLVSAAVVYAVTVPYNFSSGTVAKSSEVNSNFSYLADRSWEKSGSSLYYSSGNVGIGTANPSVGLEVNGAIKFGPDLIFNNSNTDIFGPDNGEQYFDFMAGDEGTDFTNDAHVRVWGDRIGGHENRFVDIYHDGSTGFITTAGSASGNSANLILQNYGGKVGIGITSPSYPLHMASGAYVTTGGVWTNASSRKYKEHIAELTSDEALAAFQSLTPVTYNYKIDKDEKHIGFIAEDVPAILATKDRKGISPMDVVALLTKVVQEQQKTIAALKKEVEGLKSMEN
jgi:hypothetical protein